MFLEISGTVHVFSFLDDTGLEERNLFTTIIKAGRGTVAKALMEPFIVIVFQILVYPLPCLPWILVILQVDVLIFQTPPETLNKDVVIGPATRWSILIRQPVSWNKRVYFGLVKWLP